MKKIVFIFALALSFAWNCRAQSWTFVQDGVITSCVAGASSCTMQANNIAPTTAGTIWIVRIHTGGANNVTITSVSGGGATWHLCPASSCHLNNSAYDDNQDLAYGFGGAPGTTNITVNLSGPAAQFFGGNFMEILPPPGSTPSFDTAATNTSSSCTTCTAPNLTLKGTDAVIAVLSGNGAANWNSFSSPYITDVASNGIGLNITNGAGPTVQVAGSGGDFTSIAFTSSLGTLSPPATPMSLVHYTTSQPSCSHTCSVTIPSTGTGNLLYLEAADITSSFISSVSGGGSWVIPSASNSCRILLTGGSQLSCAYVLSATAGTTTINVTMSGSGPTQLGVFEVSSSGGLFSLDAQASKTNGFNIDPPGVSFCASGCDAPALTGPDVVFGTIFAPGGPSGVTFDPYPLGGANWFFNQAAMGVRLNVSGDEKPVWAFGISNASTTATGVAFRTGTASALAPPTGLTAVVN